MKRFVWTMLALVLIVGWTVRMSLAATNGIAGTAHDFAKTSYTWNTTGEICRPCHVPMGSSGSMVTDANGVLLGSPVTNSGTTLNSPLWNHQLSGQATYIMYQANPASTSTNNNMTPGAPITPAAGTQQQVDQTSKLCLGCHDGTVALDSFGGATGSNYMGMAGTGSWAIVTGTGSVTTGQGGNDLTKMHPIGDAARWPANNTSPFATNGQPDLVAPSARNNIGIMPLSTMYDGGLAVGCVSCHDPHNSAGASGAKDYLWVANNLPASGSVPYVGPETSPDGSVLCLNCHIK